MDTFVDATSACDLIGRYPELAGSTAVIDRRLAGREFVIEAAAVGYSFRAGATAALVAAPPIPFVERYFRSSLHSR